jgi:hypothetical protein
MAQQTAVEWLYQELEKHEENESEYFSKVAIYNHAIRMEKEQIINAYNAGESDGDHYEDSSLIYHIDTFKIK